MFHSTAKEVIHYTEKKGCNELTSLRCAQHFHMNKTNYINSFVFQYFGNSYVNVMYYQMDQKSVKGR